mmetsp:Transcript_29717/g.45041  ORF Transcript_29717/g.45041 Transcript_29717/m.45041 type:complete len:458 (+) Transcript_29717:199-1572(+)
MAHQSQLLFIFIIFNSMFPSRTFVINRVTNRHIFFSPRLFLSSEPAVSKKAKKKATNYNTDTGGLRRLPVVSAPNEIINRARKVQRGVKADSNLKNAKQRAMKHGAETLTAVSQKLCIPLRDLVKGYEYELRRLHPFEKVVADLTTRARQKKDGLTLSDVLHEIHEARKEILECSKEWIAYTKSKDTAREAGEAMEEGCDRLFEIFSSRAAAPVKQIVGLQKSLRVAPAVRLDTPAVVLVGAPNVGKSSIVRAISSGTPEVNNYPFTTRGMTLGHVEVFWSDNDAIAKAAVPDRKRKINTVAPEVVIGQYAFSQLCQIMDSPGLLVRPDNERNEMESLTLAAMQHLPTAVMYVMDLSGEAGDKCSSVEDQLQLRREVRARFPRRPWIDVVSKYDLGVLDGSLEKLEEISGGDEYIKLSIQEGIGMDDLRNQVLKMLGEVRLVLDAMAAVDSRSGRSD